MNSARMADSNFMRSTPPTKLPIQHIERVKAAKVLQRCIKSKWLRHNVNCAIQVRKSQGQKVRSLPNRNTDCHLCIDMLAFEIEKIYGTCITCMNRLSKKAVGRPYFKYNACWVKPKVPINIK